MRRALIGCSTIAVIAAVVVPFLTARHAFAARDPSLNPTCWLRSQCEGLKDLKAEFEFDPACAPPWGRCYPKPQDIQIQVKLPGLEQRAVRDLAQYLQVAYVWAVRVAAVLAVIVIMVGGLLWLTSGGAERIATAKSLIGNAVIGLLLAVGSYLILQTVNPDLVTLRLPRTMIIRPLALGTTYCSQLPAEVEIRRGPDRPVLSRSELSCGTPFYVPNTTPPTCIGEICPVGNACVPTSASTSKCVPASIAGEVSGDGVAYLGGGVILYVVCANGQYGRVAGAVVEEIVPTKQHSYKFITGVGFVDMSKTCNAPEVELMADGAAPIGRPRNIRGFFLTVRVEGAINDTYAVGPKACGKHSAPITYRPEDKGKIDRIDWARVEEADLFDPVRVIRALRRVDTASLNCQLTLTRSAFPDR